MTGRLDQVDLATDVYLLAIHRTDGSIALTDLHEHLKNVDPTPFAFDALIADQARVADFVEGLRMFEGIGLLEKTGHEVSLTEIGERMAEHLEDALDADEDNALQAAGVMR